jgi:hypothetical protein
MTVAPYVPQVSLPQAAERYDRADQDRLRAELARQMAAVEQRARGPQEYLVLVSPNGARWRVSVSNAGALVIASDA